MVLRRLDGFFFGDFTGLFYGPSLDLAEVREYQPGDEVRRIDWNVTARTGAVHVRQYREEREVTGWVVLDRSPSMAFGTRRTLKERLALEFAGAAAAILTRQGNKVGALGFGPGGSRATPLAGGRRQALAILRDLERAPEPGRGPTELDGALRHVDRTLRRRTLLFVVSDFLQSGEEGEDPAWFAPLRRLAARHDVIAVRVADPAELELPDAGELRLRDPESGRELWVDTSDPAVRAAHRALVEEREKALARAVRAARADLLLLRTDRDLLPDLVRFVRRRKGRRA